MKCFYKTLPALLVVIVTVKAAGDPVMECSNQYGSQVEIGDCLANVEKNVDASIDASLGFAMNSANELDTVTGRDVAVPALEDAQSAWAAYRDRHCEFVGATYGGGSGTGAAIRGCRIKLGRARVDALLGFAK